MLQGPPDPYGLASEMGEQLQKSADGIGQIR
jgi:hypothetical protein